MRIRDHKEQYKVETKIHPRPTSNYPAIASMTEQTSNGMVTHRVDGRQPIEYGIEGLKYE